MEDKEQLANKLVNNFINNFYETFGQIEHVPTHIAEKTRNGQQTMPLEAFEQTNDIVTNPNKKLPF